MKIIIDLTTLSDELLHGLWSKALTWQGADKAHLLFRIECNRRIDADILNWEKWGECNRRNQARSK
jgi:hypothetical protein